MRHWLSLVIVSLTLLVAQVPFATPVQAAPPDAYWVGGTGNWTDDDNHQATVSGGAAANGNLPDATTNAYLDGNSFSGAGQVVTVDSTAYCNDMDWTGALFTPTFAGAAPVRVSGSLTFIADMVQTYSNVIQFVSTAGGKTITTPGTLACQTEFNGANGGWTLLTPLNQGAKTLEYGGANGMVLNTNGKTVTAGNFSIYSANTVTLTLGASVLNLSQWSYTGTNLTLTPNTSTINVIGVGGDFLGGGITTYNNVNLSAAAQTISGSNTMASLGLASGATQTITFTDGTTQTVGAATLSGSAGHVHTLQGSSTGGWAITKTGGGVVLSDYVTVSNSTGSPANTFAAGANSIDGGNNTGWTFALEVSTDAATGVTMDKDGVTGGTFHGALDDLNGAATANVYFEYGLTEAYGASTTPVARTETGAFTAAIPANLTPGATYHFRAVGTSIAGTVNGADDTLTFTMPTIVTDVATDVNGTSKTATLNGTVSAMGAASSSSVSFQWGPSVEYGQTTTAQSLTEAGSFSSQITGLWSGTYHFRSVVTNRGVAAYGSDRTLSLPKVADNYVGLPTVLSIVPTILLLSMLFGSGYFAYASYKAFKTGGNGMVEVVMAVLLLILVVTLFATSVMPSIDSLRTQP